MNSFISSEVLLSFTGCVGIVIVATHIFKKYFPLSSKTIALIFSIIVAIARIVVSAKFSAGDIVMGFINIIPIYCGAIGGYDAMLKTKSTPIQPPPMLPLNEDYEVDNKSK